MSGNQETVADIVEELRNKTGDMYDCTITTTEDEFHDYADRLEAAAKRDAAIHMMTCEANERLREHLEIALENDKREDGNAAAMRAALEIAHDYFDGSGDTPRTDVAIAIEAALYAPPSERFAQKVKPLRNCDVPLVVDGPADNNADKAWIVFKKHNPDAYFDVSGLLRCIDWLLAPAEERKGEGDEK